MIDVDSTPVKQPVQPTATARRILFLGTHGQANIGDELLLTTFLHQLGDEHHYVVNSYAPERTRAQFESEFDIEVIGTSGDRWPLLRHLVGCDAVVFGGGSIVKELYRSVGRWRYATLVMVLALVVVARLARRPVLLCGIGVGPMDTRTGRLLAAMIVRAASLVSVGDTTSYETCRSIGAGPDRVVQIPDPAFVNRTEHLLAESSLHTAPAHVDPNGRVRLALNLNRDIANGDRWDDVLAELAATGPRAFGRTIQYVFQDPVASLNPRKTIGDILDVPLRLLCCGLTRAAAVGHVAARRGRRRVKAGFGA